MGGWEPAGRACSRRTASASEGSGSTSSRITTSTQETAWIANADAVDPVRLIVSAARNGPMKYPARNIPPSSESDRARYGTGTKLVMNACLARANDEVAIPISSTPIASTPGTVAVRQSSRPPSATSAAPIIVVRSPTRATTAPLGMSPSRVPTMISAEMNPASASEPPSRAASTGITGITAPSPMANSSDGR